MKILISIILIRLTFKGKSLRIFLYQLIGFYMVSFIFAGAIVGVSFSFTDIYNILIHRVRFLEVFTYKHMGLGLIIGIVGAYKIFDFYNGRAIQDNFIAQVTIIYKSREVSIKALIDTGNTLEDPLTKSPVFIVEFDEIKEILPEQLRDIYINKLTNDFYILEEILLDLRREIKLRLIPFKSLGNDGGIILGFRPDFLKIKLKDQEVLETNMIIGIFQGKLSEDLGYNGLLNYETILQGEKG